MLWTPRYVIDTSAVIDLYRRRYPRQIFGSLWSDIDELVASQLLVTVDKVVNEIEVQPTSPDSKSQSEAAKVNRQMSDWNSNDVTKAEDLNAQTKTDVATLGLTLASTHRDWVTDDDVADPYVIAAAKTLSCAVVSSEIRSHTTEQLAIHKRIDGVYPKKTKIPSICDIYEVSHLNLIELFDAQGWSY